jgi:hypothetical protein
MVDVYGLRVDRSLYNISSSLASNDWGTAWDNFNTAYTEAITNAEESGQDVQSVKEHFSSLEQQMTQLQQAQEAYNKALNDSKRTLKGALDQLIGEDSNLLKDFNFKQGLSVFTKDFKQYFGGVVGELDTKEELISVINNLDTASVILSDVQKEALSGLVEWFSIADEGVSDLMKTMDLWQTALDNLGSFMQEQQQLIDKIQGSRATPEANIANQMARYESELSRVKSAQELYLRATSQVEQEGGFGTVSAFEFSQIENAYKQAQEGFMTIANSLTDTTLETFKSSATGQAILDRIVSDQEANIQVLADERDLIYQQIQASQTTNEILRDEIASKLDSLNNYYEKLSANGYKIVLDPNELSAFITSNANANA